MVKPGQRNKDYWQKRMAALEEEQYRRSAAYYKDVQEQFRQASNDIQLDINRWYQRLADNNDISYAGAKKLLRKNELEEFKWMVEDYIKAGKENAVDQRWMKELENASAKHHISYLEVMKLQVQQHAELLSTEFDGGMTDFLHKAYGEQYYHTAYELAKGTGIGTNLAKLDTRRVDTLIKHPWAQDGANFSDRIWTNKDKLVNNLHMELVQSVIRGAPPQQAISSLAKTMEVSRAQAGRLIMTESAAISSAAQKDCLKDLGVEKYEVLATLDERTSDICQDMDGRVFDMKDYKVGETAPPFHPNCRSTTIPHFDDEFTGDEERAARDPDTGKTYYVPAGMEYGQWKEQFVSQPNEHIMKNVEKSGGSAIMKLPRYEEATIPESKFLQYALDPDKDPDKARAFKEALGYDQSNYKDLIDNIREHLPDYEAREKPDNGHGKRYEVVMKLLGPNGKKADVLTAWIDDKNTGEMRLTTAHVDRRKKSEDKNV